MSGQGSISSLKNDGGCWQLGLRMKGRFQCHHKAGTSGAHPLDVLRHVEDVRGTSRQCYKHVAETVR